MAEERAGGKKRYHHGDLRRALLDAAATLVADGDASGLTLREIARRAGVSHAAPYRHFPDRDALVRALNADTLDALTARITDSGGRAGRAAAALVGFAADNAGRYRLLAAHGDAAQLDEERQRLELALRASVNGDREAARALWAVGHGVALLALAGSLTGTDPEHLAERAATAIASQFASTR